MSRKGNEIRCSDPLSEAARQVLAGRLDEVEALRSAIAGPQDSEALHNLRIGAKRLRYSLEMFAVCFPEGEAQGLADGVRVMQDVLGRIHDLDVLQGLLVDRIAQVDDERRQRGLETAMGTGPQWEEDLQALVDSDDRPARLGVYRVIATKADERREQYARFESLWVEWQQTGLLGAIRSMIA